MAGSQPNEHSVKAGSQGSTLSMEGALGQGSRSSLTRWRWKRFWFLARGSGFPSTRGARQGASEVFTANLAHGRKHRGNGSAARSDARFCSEMSEDCEP